MKRIEDASCCCGELLDCAACTGSAPTQLRVVIGGDVWGDICAEVECDKLEDTFILDAVLASFPDPCRYEHNFVPNVGCSIFKISATLAKIGANAFIRIRFHQGAIARNCFTKTYVGATIDCLNLVDEDIPYDAACGLFTNCNFNTATCEVTAL